MVDESQLPGTFEGIICAAGAYVEYQGKVIKALTADQMKRVEKALKIVENYQNIPDGEKVMYYNSKLSPEQLEERLGPDYHVTLPRIM